MGFIGNSRETFKINSGTFNQRARNDDDEFTSNALYKPFTVELFIGNDDACQFTGFIRFYRTERHLFQLEILKPFPVRSVFLKNEIFPYRFLFFVLNFFELWFPFRFPLTPDISTYFCLFSPMHGQTG